MSNQDRVSITLRDFDKEPGNFGFGVPDVTPVTLVGLTVAMDLIRTALLDITIGVISNQGIVLNDQYESSQTGSLIPEANRESKWLVTYQDNQEFLAIGVPNPGYRKVFNFEVPTAKLSLRQNNSSVVWVKGGATNVPEFDSFVLAVNSILRSPYGGIGDILQIEDVSRNT